MSRHLKQTSLLNYLTHASHIIYHYFETLCSFNFLPKITRPTRITPRSSTLIDNIFSTYSSNFSDIISGILTHRFSDHQPYFIFIKTRRHPPSHTPHTITIRKSSTQSLINFKNDISQQLDGIDSSPDSDPNLNYNRMNEILTTAYNEHYLLVTTEPNKYKHKKSPRIKDGLLISIKYQDKLYKNLETCSSTTGTDQHEHLTSNSRTYK